MAVRYLQSGDELPQHPAIASDDDSGGWWGGTFLRGAGIALAATMAITASQVATAQSQWTRDEQIPAGNLTAPPNEDYWQNPAAPLPATIYQRLPLGDPEEIPAGNLHGQPDEDFWQNPVAPVQATLYQRLPLGDPEEIPSGNLHGQPDEDFWINPVRPVPATLLWQQQWGFDEETPALVTVFSPVEDYWSPLATMANVVNTGFPAWFPGDNNIIPVTPPPASSSQDERISYDKYGTGNYMTGDIPIGRDQ